MSMPNHRNRRAAKAKAPRSSVSVPRIAMFPVAVALPPQRGALVRAIDLPLPPAALAPMTLASAAAPLVAMPARPAAAKPSRHKAPKRKTAKRKSVEPKLTAIAAITLPSQPEPLVTSGRALVPYRADGLMGQLSHCSPAAPRNCGNGSAGRGKPGRALRSPPRKSANCGLRTPG